MPQGEFNLNFIRALIVLVLASGPLSIWLLWTVGDELVRSVVHQDWEWTVTWGAVTMIMCCGVWRVIQEGWCLWQESRQQA